MTPQQIRAARGALNWTQSRLAVEAGIHPKAVAYWETGKGRSPHHAPLGAVPRITEAFARHGVTVEGNSLLLPG